MQEATVTPSPPTSTTRTPASSVSTAATSEAESGMSGLRRKLESEFESSPEPPSKLARYDTMPSFSFNADSSPESTTGSKNQLFEPPKATVTAQGTRRVTDLTDEEKERINKMTSAKEMPRPERFGMLKTFIVQQSVASIEVEAPESVKGRMYKVLKEVVEEKQSGSEGRSQMKLGGRVNEASAKKLLAKQLGEFAANLDSIGFLDVKTGRISGKKAKKALTPEQQAYKDMKGASQKLENQSKTIPTKLAEIRGLKIRNCSELVSALEEIESKVENALALSKGMLEGHKTCPDVEGWNQYMEVNLQPVIDLADHDIKDASKRIQNHKNTEKNKMKSSAQAGNEDPQGASEDDHEDDEDDEESQCADDCGDAGSHSSKSSKDLNLETTVAEKAQSRMDGGEFSHSTKEMRSMFKRMLNTAEFIQYGCKANPWIQLPGFHPSMVVFDWLHVVDLALIPDSAASCLIELTEVPLEQGGIFAGSDQNERLRAAYVDFIAECRKHKISLAKEAIDHGGNVESCQLASDSQRLQRIEAIRAAAMCAFHQFEYDSALRNSLLRKPRPFRGPFYEGQRVAYFRQKNSLDGEGSVEGYRQGTVVAVDQGQLWIRGVVGTKSVRLGPLEKI
ncbi:unnamed protein product [Symbiodinium microadriaticum]|nr:unnamed protein product [Symbiodinium microadriaticum]